MSPRVRQLSDVGSYFLRSARVQKVRTGLALISRTVSQGNLVQLGFVVNRAEVGKAGVQPGAGIEGFDIVEDSGASFGAGGKAVMVDQLVFQATPEGVAEGVVIAIASAAHGSEETVLSQEVPLRG